MTPTTLQALRRLLFFSVPEAARWIPASAQRPGGVTERSWRLWEDGSRKIPADVIARMSGLCGWRERALEAAVSQISEARAKLGEHNEGAAPALVWYDQVEDWCSIPARAPVLWRPQCSVIADLVARYDAVAVPFDRTAYARWRGKRPDAETLRAAWAGEQPEA